MTAAVNIFYTTMTIIRLILICLLLHLANQCPAQTNDLTNRLCKTWVAFKEIIHEPMMKKSRTLDSTQIGQDSIIIKPDHEIIRYYRNTIYYQSWEITQDSTAVKLFYKNCINCLDSRRNENFQLKTLTDTTIEMTFWWGKEGESTQRIYRRSK